MKKIEVQGTLTFENDGNLYTVTSDVYHWDPEYTYPQGTYVLYGNVLYRTTTKTTGIEFDNFEPVQPTDRITVTATNDDLALLYTSIEEIRAKLGMDPVPSTPPATDDVDPDIMVIPGMAELQNRVGTIEQTYVRTINNKPALGGNIDLDYDGTVMPPKSTIVRYTDGNIVLPQSAAITYDVDDVHVNVISYDGSLSLGSDLTHVDIKTVDALTVNGDTVVTTQSVVNLVDDQNVQGRKHFEKLFTTESPQEDNQVPNSKWVKETIEQEVAEAVKPRLNSRTVFYISVLNVTDTEDGTLEHPFKSLKNAVSYIKTIDLNFNEISLEFRDRYEDNSEMLELPELGSTVIIKSTTGLDTILPPLYVTGHWVLDGVTLSDNRLSQCPLEVDHGYCTLRNVKVELNSPAPGTDAIFVHNTGVLQLGAGADISIVNNSQVNVQRAIHIKAATMICNEDVHSNVGEVNKLTIKPDNSGFAVGLFVTNASQCVYMERTEYDCVSLPYVSRYASVIQGLSKYIGEGEQDSSSMVISSSQLNQSSL